jgi:hypothetical protein
MKMALNGRKVGIGDIAVYFENKAYFTKKGFTKRIILHELYHHIFYAYGLDMPSSKEEKAVNSYVKDFLDRRSVGP